jgi:Ca-activated chloride channel homolog
MPDWAVMLTCGAGALLGASGDGLFVVPTFDRPVWLLLIPPLSLAAWWIARRSLSGWDSSRRRVHLAIRCMVITLLCMALAEPRARWRADDVAVVAVVDVSESVPSEQRALAVEFLNASLNKRAAEDRLGMVTVARDAMVQSLPGAAVARMDIGVTGPGDASVLGKGIDLAKALVPSDAAGRVLLVSDGNETAGSLSGAVAALATAGIPIDVASVEYDRSRLVRVDDLVVPAWVRDEDTITARIRISAGRPAGGRLTLLLNGEPVDLDAATPGLSARVDLAAGSNVLLPQLRLPSGPVHRIEAVLEPDDASSSIPQLLRAEGVTFTSDRGRVLVLAEDAKAAEAWVGGVTGDNIRIDLRASSSAPSSLSEWSGYDAVVLFNQPASNFSRAQQESIVRYVHDAGGGLLVVGGPESYGAGGWIGSPLADALPVVLDPPQKRQMPMGALAIIIDRSGSMGAAVSGTGLNQQQIANEAAILGVRALSRLDQVAIVAFDGEVETVVPLTRVGDPERIARRIRSIDPRGSTNLFPAIDAAAAELARSPGGVKHVIILTDGQTAGDPRDGLARAAALKGRGITISTVAIGDQSNDPLLAELARTSGGRSYNVRSANAKAVLPQIFIKEAQTVRRTLIWEGPAFTPQMSFTGESMRGITGPLPGITGYVVSVDRGGLSTVSLRGPEGDPILAHWHHGLGRVTTFASDASTRWNAAWTSWDSFSSFWQQQLKWTMRPSGNATSRVMIDASGDRARVSLELFDQAGEHLNFAAVRARVSAPAESGASGEVSRDVAFRQVGPGRYEAEVDAAAVGSQLLSIRYDGGPGGDGAAGSRSGSVRAAIIRRAGQEFREPTPNANLLLDLARRTNGRVYRLDPAGADLWARDHLVMPETSRSIWLLAALIGVALFLIDVAARRIALDIVRIRERLLELCSRAPEAATASVSTLAAAKARAVRPSIARSGDAAARATPIPRDDESMFTGTPVRPPSPAPTASPTASPSSPARAAPKRADEDVMDRLRAAKKRSMPPDGRP